MRGLFLPMNRDGLASPPLLVNSARRAALSRTGLPLAACAFLAILRPYTRHPRLWHAPAFITGLPLQDTWSKQATLLRRTQNSGPLGDIWRHALTSITLSTLTPAAMRRTMMPPLATVNLHCSHLPLVALSTISPAPRTQFLQKRNVRGVAIENLKSSHPSMIPIAARLSLIWPSSPTSHQSVVEGCLCPPLRCRSSCLQRSHWR